MPGSKSKFGAHVLVLFLFMRTYMDMDGCRRGRSDRGCGGRFRRQETELSF